MDEISALYHALLDCWNKRDANQYAALFAKNGNIVGFDGSTVNGRSEIEAHLSGIFADHVTAAYVGKVREIRLLSPEVALLRAACGMIPSKADGKWHIEMFHNTPAQFHGRSKFADAPEDVDRFLIRC